MGGGSQCRWVDSLSNNGGRRGGRASMSSGSASNSRLGGRGLGGGGHASDMTTTFVSAATGEPINPTSNRRRCYVCGDPSHFANACPNRGS